MPSAPPQTTPTSPRRTLAVWLATGLGIGLVMPAPGTFGTLWGLPLAWGIFQLPGWPWQLLGIAVIFLVGVPLTTAAARDLGGVKDPGCIVWDELAALPIVFLPVGFTTWWVAVLGFAAFRLMDISKPWPCRRLERLPEGWGVMIDDLIAAIYAAGLVWVVVAGGDWLWGDA